MAIRDAHAADYDVYTQLVRELRVDDPIPSRERFVAELCARMMIATDGDEVVGYALFDQLDDVGYVRNLVTDPAQRRRGHGHALMTALRARFLAAGATAWCLNVKPDNAPAIALYERCGMQLAYRSYALRLPATSALPPPPANVRMTPIAPHDDAHLERTMKLLRGQLAQARARPSRRVVQLVRDDEVVGAGVFSASIPGAFPFRMTDPALAGAFLAYLRTLAPPDAPFVQVGTEDDEPLRDAVLALGAYVQLEIVHMRGPIA